MSPLRKNNTTEVLAWILVAVWAIVIFLMSSNTGNDLNRGQGFIGIIYQWLDGYQKAWFGNDADYITTIAHFCEYAIFGALLCHALGQRITIGHAVIGALAIAAAYGITDEVHQLFVPGRTFDMLDWLTDCVGASFGAFVGGLLGRALHAQSKNS